MRLQRAKVMRCNVFDRFLNIRYNVFIELWTGMALLLRQAIRCCGSSTIGASSHLWRNTKLMTPCARHVTGIADQPGESFVDKNERLQRPLSPHMTIYKWEMTANMSLAHRTTGILMTSGVYGFGIGMMLLPGNFPHYLNALQSMHLSPALIYGAKFVIAFPLMFHFCSGLRHLAWDLGKGFSIKDLYKSGYLAIATAFALTTIVAAL